MKDITNVINFDAPKTYSSYKANATHLDFDNGAMLTLISPDSEKEQLELYKKKLSGQSIFKCIPVIWEELLKIKSRVEDVTRTLDNKTVKNEKTNEFKKQLLSNKRLKEYFRQHPDEKEILMNDLKKNDTTTKNALLFKHLSFLPSYVLPS